MTSLDISTPLFRCELLRVAFSAQNDDRDEFGPAVTFVVASLLVRAGSLRQLLLNSGETMLVHHRVVSSGEGALPGPGRDHTCTSCSPNPQHDDLPGRVTHPFSS